MAKSAFITFHVFEWNIYGNFPHSAVKLVKILSDNFSKIDPFPSTVMDRCWELSIFNALPNLYRLFFMEKRWFYNRCYERKAIRNEFLAFLWRRCLFVFVNFWLCWKFILRSFFCQRFVKRINCENRFRWRLGGCRTQIETLRFERKFVFGPVRQIAMELKNVAHQQSSAFFVLSPESRYLE